MLTHQTRFILAAIVLAALCPWSFPAGLGEDTPAMAADQVETDRAFRLALPGYQYRFPRDHGSHDEFRTEWWYYTGHLESAEGRRFGYELTFFRRAVPQDGHRPSRSRWAIRHVYLAHFAVTDVETGRFLYAEKISRAGLGKAGAEAGRLHVWTDRWVAEMGPAGRDQQPLNAHHLAASTEEFSIDLHLMPDKPPIIHGQGGVSRKGASRGQASHYYSVTRLITGGTLSLNGREFPVTGLSWMDHEFGSANLEDAVVGWDWFSVQLNDHTELMLYVLRWGDGAPDPASSGTFLSSSGGSRHLYGRDFHIDVLDHWVSEASGARYPSRWRITVAPLDITLELRPLLADQELMTSKSTQITYWEGAVAVTGKRGRGAVTGQGYVELTGYAKPLAKAL